MKIRISVRELRVMVWGKTVVAVLLAGVVAYSIIAGTPVDAELLKVVLVLLAGYFGLSARVEYRALREGRGGGGGG